MSKTVNQLKEELKCRGLPSAGKKADLVKRLESFIKEKEVRLSLVLSSKFLASSSD